jgi:hypothetical protein
MKPSTPGILDLESHLRGFQRHLRASNRSPRTIEKYDLCARQLLEFLERTGMPTATTSVHREHIESFIEDTLARGRSAATANTPFQGLRVFFAYLVEEGELERSPMERMKSPAVPEAPVPVVGEDFLREMLRTCAGKDFEDRRDNAILRLFIDTGMRPTGADDLQRGPPDGEAPLDRRRSADPSSPAAAHLRPHVAGGRGIGRRPHAPGRLALPGHAVPLRCLDGGRPGPGSAPPGVARRPPLIARSGSATMTFPDPEGDADVL